MFLAARCHTAEPLSHVLALKGHVGNVVAGSVDVEWIAALTSAAFWDQAGKIELFVPCCLICLGKSTSCALYWIPGILERSSRLAHYLLQVCSSDASQSFRHCPGSSSVHITIWVLSAVWLRCNSLQVKS